MTGIRRTIYIPEDELPGIEEAARKMERSVSWYLINLHRERLGQKESRKPANPEKYKSHRADEPADIIPAPEKKRERPPKKPKAKKPEKWVNPLENSVLAPREEK